MVSCTEISSDASALLRRLDGTENCCFSIFWLGVGYEFMKEYGVCGDAWL